MVDRIKTLGIVGLVVVLAVTWGCSRRPSRVHAPGIDASAAGQAAMNEYDTNKDGKVAGDELTKAPSLRAALVKLDTNGDKAVSAEEVAARIDRWQESKIGVMSVTCQVRFGGRPLPDAKLVFEPEKFLGENMKAAEAQTDQQGNAMPSIPGGEYPGMSPGLYKVRVTSDKVKIPPKYNTETVLAVEIANDSNDMADGGAIQLDLK